MTDPHPPPLRALQEDGDADTFAQTSVKEDTLSRRGTSVARDNRLAISVQTHFFDFGSVAAVDRKLFRSADAWDEFSFAGSPRGEERADLSEAVLKLLARSVVLGILVVHQQDSSLTL